jgi:hypothetical protein
MLVFLSLLDSWIKYMYYLNPQFILTIKFLSWLSCQMQNPSWALNEYLNNIRSPNIVLSVHFIFTEKLYISAQTNRNIFFGPIHLRRKWTKPCCHVKPFWQCATCGMLIGQNKFIIFCRALSPRTSTWFLAKSQETVRFLENRKEDKNMKMESWRLFEEFME